MSTEYEVKTIIREIFRMWGELKRHEEDPRFDSAWLEVDRPVYGMVKLEKSGRLRFAIDEQYSWYYKGYLRRQARRERFKGLKELPWNPPSINALRVLDAMVDHYGIHRINTQMFPMNHYWRHFSFRFEREGDIYPVLNASLSGTRFTARLVDTDKYEFSYWNAFDSATNFLREDGRFWLSEGQKTAA